MNKDSKIFVAGQRGMVGSAIIRKLHEEGYNNVMQRECTDLSQQIRTNIFFDHERPDYVFIAAAKVGGIVANDSLRAQFIYDNLMIQTNIIDAAYRYGVIKLLFLGSSCIYPKQYSKPWKEEDLLSGHLEPTNEPYAIAKIAGIKMCEAYRDQYGCNFISVMPPNLYGRGDRYMQHTSHVVPALIKRFHEAKINGETEVIVWGSGKPYRELMYSDDFADCCIFLMNNYNERLFINTGTGEEVTINKLAHIIKSVVEFKGEIYFDHRKPDGVMRKVMDIGRIHNLGWHHKTSLIEGLQQSYKYFKEEYGNQ